MQRSSANKTLRWILTALAAGAIVWSLGQFGQYSSSAAPAPPVNSPTLASWNVMRLGHGEKKDYPLLGEIVRLGSFDFLAAQEVMTDEGLDRLRDSIETATGAQWETQSSHAIGRGSRLEKYAFLWNTEVIEYVDGAVVYLDLADHFAREPYSARFRVRASGLTFVAATVHIIYGDTLADRTLEIKTLAEYWRWLQEIYPADAGRILLLGDFNLKPQRPEWDALRAVATPLIADGATTLSSIEGRFANLYDNIWVPVEPHLPILASGILEFPAAVGLTHEEARRHVSDHAPVWVTLGPIAEREYTSRRRGDLGSPASAASPD